MQCSVPCGGGVKRRKIQCLTRTTPLTPSPDCPAITKPTMRQPCNLHTCAPHPSVLANVRLPDGSSLVVVSPPSPPLHGQDNTAPDTSSQVEEEEEDSSGDHDISQQKIENNVNAATLKDVSTLGNSGSSSGISAHTVIADNSADDNNGEDTAAVTAVGNSGNSANEFGNDDSFKEENVDSALQNERDPATGNENDEDAKGVNASANEIQDDGDLNKEGVATSEDKEERDGSHNNNKDGKEQKPSKYRRYDTGMNDTY